MRYRGAVLLVVFAIGVFLVILSQQGREKKPRSLLEGLKVPDFVVYDKQGNEYRLSALKGKRVFVHFWAAWCKECRTELPAIKDLYERKKDDPGFVFLSVIWREDPIKSRKYLESQGIDIPIFTDPGEKMAKSFGVTGVPETYIIGPDGVLQKKVIGPGRWESFN